ncbi:MAG: polysaccharide deacetylase family protein [bacterium]
MPWQRGGWIVWLMLMGIIRTAPAAGAQTVAERLGYPQDARLLIVHADDIGMCHSSNVAFMEAAKGGSISAGSVMVPCPWFLEIADFAKNHPEADLGLHLTLTAEWKYYRWRPLAPALSVPGLLDPQGCMFRDVLPVAQNAKPEELETEVRAQIDYALAQGMKPTHLDSHMGTLFAKKEFLAVALKLAEEYDIPFMFFNPTPQILQMAGDRYDLKTHAELARRGWPMLDGLYSIEDTPVEESETFYQEVIRNLKSGVSEIIIHPAAESPEIEAITGSWKQRNADLRIFTDPAMKRFIEAQGVKLVGWKQLYDLWKARPR